VGLVSAPFAMFVEQKNGAKIHTTKLKQKMIITWPLVVGFSGFFKKESSQSFLTQLLAFFANFCCMSDYQNVLALNVVRKPPEEKSGAENSQTTVVCCVQSCICLSQRHGLGVPDPPSPPPVS
jgi:hypothetical protein